MIIQIKAGHIHRGQPRLGRCPLSLACQDAFRLDGRCIGVSPCVLSVVTYGGVTIYSEKWPEVASDFYRKYFEVYRIGGRVPHPCKFEMGLYDFGDGIEVDLLEKAIKKVENWDGRAGETPSWAEAL